MYKQLTREQRYTIDILLKQKQRKKDIAQAIGVHPSTITCEINRNKSKRGGYSYEMANELSEERIFRLPGNRAISESVKNKAICFLKEEQWSPKQISGSLKLQGINISHETIYEIIREDKTNGGDLYKNCRHKLKHRKRCKWTTTHIRDRISIKDRPKIVDEKKRFGDWEMDTIVGKNNSGAIVTLTERTTNFLLMEYLPNGKNAKSLAEIVYRLLLPYKKSVLTITTDNGSEFAEHAILAKKLNTTIYFTDPYSSWQKGAVENINKLIRQYIPKKTSFGSLSTNYIKDIQMKINRRPREKLSFRCPKQVFFKNFL